MQPLAPYTGRAVNPHILYGQQDMQNEPVTFARIATRWGDVQLSNGWQFTNYGNRMGFREAGYLIAVNQPLHGQTRLTGSNPSDFPAKGPAPSQWDYHVMSSAGAQPNYPGGPGYIMGKPGYVGSAGG